MDIVAENITVSKQINQNVTGNTDSPTGIIAGWRRVTDDGTGTRSTGNGGYREDYATYAQRVGFDVGHVYLHSIESVSANGHYEGEWHVAVSPRDTAGAWSSYLVEWNVGNRATDMGYRENISGSRSTGGHLTVATVPGAFGPPGSSKNVDFAYAAAGGKNDSQAQFYNGFLVNEDAIAKGGRGIQISGDTGRYTDAMPYCPVAVGKTWQTGIRLENATFRDKTAITLGATQKIAKTNGTEAVFLTPKQMTRLKRMLRR